jgi:hypothetical protein
LSFKESAIVVYVLFAKIWLCLAVSEKTKENKQTKKKHPLFRTKIFIKQSRDAVIKLRLKVASSGRVPEFKPQSYKKKKVKLPTGQKK